MYSNKLIFGKCDIQNVVSVEPIDGGLVLFQEINGEVTNTVIDNEYWVLTDRKVSSKQRQLEGDQHYKWIATFDTLEQQREVRGILKKNRIDKYDIYNAKEASMVYNGVTYFKGMKPQDVSVLSFDIESDGLLHTNKSEVYIISNTYRKMGKVIKRLFSLEDYDNQRDMLEDWCNWVRELDPAIVLGHNIFYYDFLYLNHVANLNMTTLSLGRDGSSLQIDPYESKFRIDGNQDLDYKNCNIFGREIVDTMFLSYKYDIGKNFISYGLKSIIKQLGLEKEGRSFIDASKIREYYYNRDKDPDMWNKVKQYADEDSEDSLKLFDLMIPSVFYFTQTVSKTFQQMINSASGSQLNNILIRAYLQDNHSIAKASEVTGYQGAISWAKPGIYSNCVRWDAASLYPSIMRQYKLYCKDKDPKKYFIEITNYFALERLKNKKLAKDTGEQYYKDLEQSQKVGANSLYGFLSSPGLGYNYPEGAAFVTAKGREILERMIYWATSKKFEELKNAT